MRVLAALTVCAGLFVQAQQQPVIRSRVTMVPLDVRVVDKDGKPITDLKAEDFVVTEDGAKQSIAHFSAHGLSAQPAGAAAPLEFASDAGEARESTPPPNRRVLFVVLSRGRHQAFKHANALADFIGSRLMPQDAVAISAWNRTTDFLTDHPRLRDVAVRYAERHETIETWIREWSSGLRGRIPGATLILPAYIQKEIDWVFEPVAHLRQAPSPSGQPGLSDFMRRSVPEHVYSDTVRMLAGLNYMRFLSGEKRIVYLTEFGTGILRPRDNRRDVASRAADARVAIDVIQTGGTIGARPASFAGPMSSRSISMPIMPSSGAISDFIWQLRDIRETAASTGGLGSTLKRGQEAFAALSALTGFQYLLGYYPANASIDGGYRLIKVTVSRPGARVLVRDGYFASARREALDLREYETVAKLQEAKRSRLALAAIPLEVLSVKKISPLQLEAEVRVSLKTVTAAEENGLRVASIDMAVVATDDRRQPVGDMTRRVDLKVLPARWEQMQREGLTVSLRLSVERNARELKVIAYDYASGNLGSVIVQVK